ncbi:multiple sugar transport system substrate-binding protein [Cryobacterium flavum]|uniref:Multiple sugar transport system substrate-binding protein n=1 Tax=Cryobacterium flavum TaxID=1424659 RepID=A0A4R8V5S0_9MICO|nr:sugar ABC transporter substrate-binding protein [Cryobacterium flavum]TFB77618.1 sugar ABC transporter substrate-binding protein [Cryobacterium flavum]SDM51627.1 multiple sugar transport system substrate-binding protein [Cryobacterium flavum]
MAKRSTIIAAGVAGVLLVIAGAVTALNFSSSESSSDATTVTVRLWDEQVAAAYEKSFSAFERDNPDIQVGVEIVPWDDYFEKLRTDVAGAGAPDVFWVDGGSYPAYADAGALLDITTALPADAQAGWSAPVVAQYTRDATLWGVPQLADPGIAVYYNADLLGDAGLTADDVSALTWDPTGDNDTLIGVLQKLTKDYNGNTADSAEFDGSNLSQYGYNAGYDLQAMVLNYLASNGAQFQDESNQYAFASDAGIASFQYLVDLMNKWQVAPSAADTNTNGDFSREQFLQGKMALFQSGVYNLANVSAGANFDWGVVRLPSGPAGAISGVDGIAAAGNAASQHPAETQRVLEWLGSAAGSEFIGASGAASPAVLAAQPAYAAYWTSENVDISPFYDVLAAGTAPAPRGAGWPAAENAMRPLLDEVFIGRTPVDSGVRAAQNAANATQTE